MTTPLSMLHEGNEFDDRSRLPLRYITYRRHTDEDSGSHVVLYSELGTHAESRFTRKSLPFFLTLSIVVDISCLSNKLSIVVDPSLLSNKH